MNSDRWTLHRGDCLEVLRTMEARSVDSLVTDPPAGIAFMGQAWDDVRSPKHANWNAPKPKARKGDGKFQPGTDVGAKLAPRCRACGHQAWSGTPCTCEVPDWDTGASDLRRAFVAWLTPILVECRRVLKPGAHALVWALPRTSHWTGHAVEDAGFDVRDVVHHIFATGFPKSLNLGEGRGTALKPAHEHWWLARAPLEGTTTANVAKYGTGALSVDECRTEVSPEDRDAIANAGGWARAGYVARPGTSLSGSVDGSLNRALRDADYHEAGRWPANLVVSHLEGCVQVRAGSGWECVAGCVAAELDRQSGVAGGGFGTRGAGPLDGRTSYALPVPGESVGYGDEGGASRFFYCPKPSTAERDAGLEDLAVKSPGALTGRKDGSKGMRNPRAGASSSAGGGRRNLHPTVKSVSLMRWLVKLVTPPGGICLDPFAGSGSTGCGALMEGRRFVGVEREDQYAKIAVRRLAYAASRPVGGDYLPESAPKVDPRQGTLF